MMGGLLGGNEPQVIQPQPLPTPKPAVPLPTQNARDKAIAEQAIVKRRQSANTILTEEDDLGA